VNPAPNATISTFEPGFRSSISTASSRITAASPRISAWSKSKFTPRSTIFSFTASVGGGGGKLWRVGKVGLPINTQLQAFYNAETPEFGPDWQLRAQVQFLFPR